jgi:membrane peptidoglycan carboxypeptidase
MGRDMRDSYREWTRGGRGGEPDGYERPADRGGRYQPYDDYDDRSGPRSRPGGSNGSGRGNGRNGVPADSGGRRAGGFIKPPIVRDEDDDAPSGRRSAPSYAGDSRGPSRPPSNPRTRGRAARDDSDEYERVTAGPGRGRRSMASMAREMSRQFSAMMSRTGRAIRDAGSPPREMTPPPSRRVAIPPEIVQELGSRPYRRSRARLLARKWRLGRVGPNPIVFAVGVAAMLLLTLVIVFAGGAGGVYAVNYYQYHLADIQGIANLKNQQSSEIFDRNGQLLYTVHDDNGYQYYVALSQISEKVQWATIDTEDRTFYSNIGVDFVGTARAALTDLRAGGAAQGGSTITQQVVKNIVLHDTAKALQRKINEAILAIGVTQQYTKAQILEMYLNTIPYGDQNIGIEAAARNYFGLQPKTMPDGTVETAAQQLTWAQAGLLAGLPNAPTLYLPIQYSCSKAPCPMSSWDQPFVNNECGNFIPSFGPEWYLTHGHEWLDYCRAAEVLGNVEKYGLPASDGTFTQDDFNTAMQQVQQMLEQQQIFHWAGRNNGSAVNGIKLAPSFVDYVVQQLGDNWGIANLETGGYKIWTTLDYNLEKYAEQDMQYYIDQPHKNPWYPVGGCGPGGALDCPLATAKNAHDGALIAMDQRTGDILAMVGSDNYNSNDPRVAGKYNVVISPRSMGSATKPVVYATAFQMGWTPGVMLQDQPICFPVPLMDSNNKPVTTPSAPSCKGWYSPTNYEVKNFSGLFPARYMLGNSLNIGATETMSFVGDAPATAGPFLAMAQRLGIDTFQQKDMGPSTALGTQVMPLMELTGAYATFANAGRRALPRIILRIEGPDGQVLYPTPQTPPVPPTYQVISPQAAYMITSILTDNLARAQDFGSVKNPLHWEPSRGENYTMALAAKTGTSSGANGPVDIVTVGYSPFMTLGVWLGNADGSSMAGDIIGIAGAGYVFHDVMLWAMLNYHWPQNAQFPIPPGMALGEFNCNTGLAPYQNEPQADLTCTARPFAPGSKDLYDEYPLQPGVLARPDKDWYIVGQEFRQS